jgi:hypothetical protein
MAIELHNHEERQQDTIVSTNSVDLFSDLVSVPADRRHESRINHSLPGLIVAICVTIPGAAVLDGPGFVPDPLALMSHAADAAAHGIWVEAVPLIDFRPELPAIEPYLIATRYR